MALDGHVDYINTNTFNRMSNNRGGGPGGKGLLWWAPTITDGGYTEGRALIRPLGRQRC